MIADSRQHWETVYETKAPEEVSWFQRELRLSASLIERAAASRDARIVDVGAGASTLVDKLLADSYSNITVLDLSSAALSRVQERLGTEASRVKWVAADVLTFNFPPESFDVWHDRAVFHFLTRAEDRERYITQVQRALRPGGHILVATFAEDGPTRCSGLPVTRYSPVALHDVFGAGFVLEESVREDHVTPRGSHQAFTYCLCRWEPNTSAIAAA